MLHYDIAVIRAVHADRIRRDLAPRQVHDLRRDPPRRPIRRAIGRSMVRIGAWLAADSNHGLVRSR